MTTAITCFAFAPHSYADAVSRAIALGNDTDTLAAMAGSLSGAFLGAAALPEALLSKLENGSKGRGHIEGLAVALCRNLLGVAT